MTAEHSTGGRPLRVGMLLFGDVTHDARVLREARTLAAAGHRVRLVVAQSAAGSARSWSPTALDPAAEPPGRIELVTVPAPAGLPVAIEWLWRPWRLRDRTSAALRSEWRRGPVGWPAIGAILALVVGSLPWIVVRGAIHGLARALGRHGSGIDWLLWWRFTVVEWGARAGRAVGRVDVWHGHDLPGLVAVESARAAVRRDAREPKTEGSVDRDPATIYDSHEIYLESRTNVARPEWARRLVGRWERGLTVRAFGVVTVNDALAVELDRRIRPRRIVVAHNCPPRWTPPDIPTDRLRSAAGIPASAAVLLYHGGFLPHRGLLETATALLEPGLEDAHLVLLGFGRERAALDRLARDPRFGGRLHVLAGVPPDDLADWVSGADVDIMAIAPSTLNHVLSTPNKLFESLAAGVPVVVSDLPEMRRVVLDDPAGVLGAVCDPSDPASIGAAIRSILQQSGADGGELRRRCLAAAHARWNWELESLRLVALYEDLAAWIAAGTGSSPDRPQARQS